MVAYNFQPSFWPAIVARTKTQTIRRPRARHARPGELVQLYGGLRQPGAFKIIPDVECVALDEVEIDVRESRPGAALVVNGIPIIGADADAYALSDGFDAPDGRSHFRLMGRWWFHTYGPMRFEGVAIRWRDPS